MIIHPYKGRTPVPGEQLKVHRNLRDKTGREVWSVLARRDGKDVVIGHAPFLVLDGVQFRVRQAGVRQALKTGQRNVHAYAIGQLAAQPVKVAQQREIRYNPFKAGYFTDERGEPVSWAVRVLFDPYGRVWAA